MIRNKKRSLRPWLAAAFVVVALALGFWLVGRGSHHADSPAEKTETISVQTITATSQRVPDEIWASGSVAPVFQARLAPRIMSTVTAVLVKEGDRVRTGQVLVRLESKDLAAQVASSGAALSSAESMRAKASTAVELQTAQTKASIANAESALQIARQHLSVIKEGPRRQEKTQAMLAVAQAEAQFKNSESELARMARLYDQGAVAKQSLEAAQTQHDVAKAQLGIAKQHAEISEEGSRTQDIHAAEESVRQAEQNLRLAKSAAIQDKMARREAQTATSMVAQASAGRKAASVTLGYATLVAPISGVVTARYVDPGDTASPGMPVLIIEDDSAYRLEATAAVQNAGEITAGMTVRLELGTDKRAGEGRIVTVFPASDPASHKFLVKVDVPKSLRPVSGEFGRVSFPVGDKKGIMIPERALHVQDGITNVYVAARDNRTDMRIVRVGRRSAGKVEVITGLQPRDRVITSSSAPLADDVPVLVEESKL